MMARNAARMERFRDHLHGISSFVEIYDRPPPEIPRAVKILSLFGESSWQGQTLLFYDDGSGELSADNNRELKAARIMFPESQIMWGLVKGG